MQIIATETITTLTVPAGGAFTYTPDPTVLVLADHAIIPVCILILALVFIFKFAKPIGRRIEGITRIKAPGLEINVAESPIYESVRPDIKILTSTVHNPSDTTGTPVDGSGKRPQLPLPSEDDS